MTPRSEGLKKAMEMELDKAIVAVKEHRSRLENLNLKEARRILTIIFKQMQEFAMWLDIIKHYPHGSP